MLTGKIAVVTGASRGIGKEIAKTLAAKGATVVVNYNGSAAKAEETVKEIEALGGKAEALQCNVSEYDKAAEMMEYVVKTYGRVEERNYEKEHEKSNCHDHGRYDGRTVRRMWFLSI